MSPENAMLEAAEAVQDPVDELFLNKSITDLLADLAALSPGLGPVELVRCWFDDLYFPGQPLPQQYPLETWERGQREWKSCFNEHELQTLAKFHEAFAAEIDTLPITGEWQQDPGWQRVSNAARAALDHLENPSSQPE